MSDFMVGNIFLGASLFLGSLSQVLLKSLLKQYGRFDSWFEIIHRLDAAAMLRLIFVGMMIGAGFLCWILSLTRLNLSYAYPIACGSALLVALFSYWILGEPFTFKIWIGTAFIVLGSLFLIPVR